MAGHDFDQQLERVKFARQELDKERGHRRDKVWKLFSWSGTLLVAIIGGTVALKTDPQNDLTLSLSTRVVLIAAVIVVSMYGIWWIKQNLDIEDKVQKAIDERDRELGIAKILPDGRPNFGYWQALLLLAIAAIVAIIVDV